MYSQPESESFHVRGANYLRDHIKIPCTQSIFQLDGVDLFESDSPMTHIAANSSRMSSPQEENELFLIINFMIPNNISFIMYFKTNKV
jgi:hypothetical protein